MEKPIQVDMEKFADVVHYIVHYIEAKHGSDALGNTKLHKALYYADFLTYLRHMRPLTGCEYQRQQFGPAARYLPLTISALAADHRVESKLVDYFGYKKREYHSLIAPASNRLSTDERELIEEVANFVCVHTATEISEFSHDDVWSSVGMGETIPYYAAFALFPAEVTEDDIAAARAEVPYIEAEKRARSRI